LGADPIKQLFDVGALIGFKAIQNRRSLGAKKGLAALGDLAQRTPALGPQINAGGFQAMLKILEITGDDRQGVAQQG
jgi:hypothetical protein